MTKRHLLRATWVPAITFSIGLAAGAWAFSNEPAEAPASTPRSEAAGAADAASSALTVSAAATSVAAEADEDAQIAEPEQVAESEKDPAQADEQQMLLARLEELSQGWGRMQAELVALQQRVVSLERRPLPVVDDAGVDGGSDAARPRTPQEQRDALVRAGVAAGTADEILWRRSQAELDRLELRDQALREGWLGTDRYREEMRALNAERVSLRDELDVDAYDRYLYETGESNRVSVDSVIAGSAGDESGLMPGDVIERYGDQLVLDFNDLRSATSAGARGELVPVQVRRGGQLVEVWLPRGPIGIRLDAARVDPNS